MTYKLGAKLADELIGNYKTRHGEYPDKLTFNIWGTETMRNEGVQEAQILYLMGIKPKWNERGVVSGMEVIPREELGRPRIDVTIVPSAIYGVLFANIMQWLDQAVSLAKTQEEADNLLRKNVLNTKAMLIKKGLSDEIAERLATVRIFTVPIGTYDHGLEAIVPESSAWETEQEVIDPYFLRLSYVYGQGYWSEKVMQENEDLSLTLFKNALSGTKVSVWSRSTNTYGTLDGDDPFSRFGGVNMAIRSIDGKSPEMFITNLTDPRKPVQETLEKYMGREMRTRYLNPSWIKEMMAEGYAGAKFVNGIFEFLWAWQVTVPEVVDEAKWNEMYETYILDRNGLGIQDLFRKANNLWAYQELTVRMLEAIRKGYWKPDQTVVDTLSRVAQSTITELGIECSVEKCGNPGLTKLVSTGFVPIPQASPTPTTASVDTRVQQMAMQSANPKAWKRAPGQKTPESGQEMDVIKGFEMQDLSQVGQNPIRLHIAYVIGFLLVVVGLIAYGFMIRRSPRHIS